MKHSPRLAFDRAMTARRIDLDGRLHVAVTPISKANVCGYFGSEIPDAERFGLDPRRVYQLLRDPRELEAAADSFNNLPILATHYPQSASDPRKDLVIGATGSVGEFRAPYLMNGIVIWDGAAIGQIESGAKRQLSAAYRYTFDATPGVYKGQSFDGVMRSISGSHVALVEEGRAGPDVMVMDGRPNRATPAQWRVFAKQFHGAA